jgi:outer membrane cobalamin receptor
MVASSALCQNQPSGANQTVAADPITIIVTGTFEPIPLSEANRSVLSLDAQTTPLLYGSFVDYLHLDPSVDLEERGSDGVQADLSIRGAGFEQSLVLLNGLRINDAQSGHHDMDIPVPLEALSRIEVLHGAGSTLYGADALGGAVNFITTSPEAAELRVRFGGGNFGFNQQRVLGSYLGKNWSEQLAGSRDFSTGFMSDRDYSSNAVSSETRFTTAVGNTDLLLAGSDRPFGANQFYGSFPSWERTKSWFASIDQQLGKNTDLAFGYRRHSDEFVLVRDNPALYENNHISQSWQAAVRRRSTFASKSTIAYGVDMDGDSIDSNNLGHHARNRGAGYLDVDLQALSRLFFSLGAREEIFSGGRAEFAPTVAGGVWLRSGLRLRASASRGFRLPTYTDLYYSDPANRGNPSLKPESGWDFEFGPQWNSGGHLSAELTFFRRLEHNDIDYIKSSFADPWQAMNIQDLSFTGVETIFRLRLPKSQELALGYTALSGSEQPQPGVISKYVFNYPSHNATFSWLGQFHKSLAVRTRVGAIQRFGHDAYPIWDLAASRTNGRIRPYLQLSNLSNTGYEEIPGVAMPGRSIVGGLELVLSRTRRP